MSRRRRILGNILGAFSDGAILFPLLVLLERSAGFSMDRALFSTGLIYVAAAWYFRVPLSVQPLKSIAVASVAVGATFTEIRVSAFLLGSVCFLASFFNVNQLARKIPESIIHQLQVGLGVLLITQGLQADSGYATLLLAVVIVLLPEIKGVPLLGMVAASGLVYAILNASPADVASRQVAMEALRPGLILSLVLPQLILTSTNSVLATRNVCERYFGSEGASRVTIRRLLRSIGLGNVAVSLFGGMPFCHGSGGVTAHVRGGSTHPGSTAFMGVVLIVLAGIHRFHGSLPIVYPAVLIGGLLMATGCFHFKLALPTVRTPFGALKILAALVISFWTRNLVWVLVGAIVFEFLSSKLSTREVQV